MNEEDGDATFSQDKQSYRLGHSSFSHDMMRGYFVSARQFRPFAITRLFSSLQQMMRAHITASKFGHFLSRRAAFIKI